MIFLAILTLAAPLLAGVIVAGLWLAAPKVLPIKLVPVRFRTTPHEGSEVRCTYCHDPVERHDTKHCHYCRALLHAGCWSENQGCTTLGCRLTLVRRRRPAAARAEQPALALAS